MSEVTNKTLLEADAILAKYAGVVSAAMPADMQKERAEILRRVRRSARFSYGISRNINAIRPGLISYQEAMKMEELSAFQKDHRDLLDKDLLDAEMKEAVAALREKHNMDSVEKELLKRREDLLGTPADVKLYRIPITDLPGWNDTSEATEDQRSGVVDPIDIAMLMDIGILYDPSEEMTASEKK